VCKKFLTVIFVALLVACSPTREATMSKTVIASDVVESNKESHSELKLERAIEWNSFGRALLSAKELKKPIVLYVYADYCSVCFTMDFKTWQNSHVINTMKDIAIPARLNLENTPEEIVPTVIPATMFFTYDGKKIISVEGFRTAKDMNVLLKVLGQFHSEYMLKEHAKKSN